jgi:cytochrome P450
LLEGRRVEPETDITVSIFLLCRDPDLFEEPMRFEPHRWLGKAATPTPLELVPFGTGAHFCLGYNLAWLEAVQTLVGLALALGERRLLPARLPRFHMPAMSFPMLRPSPQESVVLS